MNKHGNDSILDSHDIHNARTNIQSASARLRGSDQLPLRDSCPRSSWADKIDNAVESRGSYWGHSAQAKFFLRKLISPLVEESWEWTSAVSLSSGSIFLASCLPSSTLIMRMWGEKTWIQEIWWVQSCLNTFWKICKNVSTVPQSESCTV